MAPPAAIRETARGNKPGPALDLRCRPRLADSFVRFPSPRGNFPRLSDSRPTNLPPLVQNRLPDNRVAPSPRISAHRLPSRPPEDRRQSDFAPHPTHVDSARDHVPKAARSYIS